MQTREVVGLCVLPLVLLIAAGNLTFSSFGSVGWFCSMFAVCVLILTIAGLCLGRSPTALPIQVLVVLYLPCVALVAVGLAIRGYYSEEILALQTTPFGTPRARPKVEPMFQFVAIAYEWVAFVAILGCVFLAAFLNRRAGRGREPADAAD